MFQFLIGSLVTKAMEKVQEYEMEFQFLIGSLVTCGTHLNIGTYNWVSIPHR